MTTKIFVNNGLNDNLPIPKAMMSTKKNRISKEHIHVIIASSLGTVFEWYDFFLYGALASIIAEHFFSSLSSGAAFLMALLTFAAGFAVRPLGAIVFGPLGDKIGRKYTFLLTIILMGCSTFCVGILPTYSTFGIAAPIILVSLRCLQGLTVGGEYGGAATYVAEHAPEGRAGYYTGFIQASAGAGLFLSLIVIIIIRSILGETIFQAWGWRLPFIFSVFLLAISVFIRMRLQESPVFKEMKEAGEHSKSPLKDTFKDMNNLKTIILVLFGPMSGHSVVWYTANFYQLFFLTQTLKVDFLLANVMMAIALVVSTGLYVFFGWLSDKFGPKIINMSGCLVGAVLIYPVFLWMTHFANPELESAMRNSPAVVIADPSECSFQFAPSELKEHIKFTSSCDVLKGLLGQYSVSYKTEAGAPGTLARVKFGNMTIESVDTTGMTPLEAHQAQTNFSSAVQQLILSSGYPLKADSSKINYFMTTLLMIVILLFGTMTYGPLASWLVDLFPPHIRYTSMSIPYNIGTGWIGGFLPSISFALVLMSGNIYAGLWYPIGFSILAFIVGCVFLKDAKKTKNSIAYASVKNCRTFFTRI